MKQQSLLLFGWQAEMTAITQANQASTMKMQRRLSKVRAGVIDSAATLSFYFANILLLLRSAAPPRWLGYPRNPNFEVSHSIALLREDEIIGADDLAGFSSFFCSAASGFASGDSGTSSLLPSVAPVNNAPPVGGGESGGAASGFSTSAGSPLKSELSACCGWGGKTSALLSTTGAHGVCLATAGSGVTSGCATIGCCGIEGPRSFTALASAPPAFASDEESSAVGFVGSGSTRGFAGVVVGWTGGSLLTKNLSRSCSVSLDRLLTTFAFDVENLSTLP